MLRDSRGYAAGMELGSSFVERSARSWPAAAPMPSARSHWRSLAETAIRFRQDVLEWVAATPVEDAVKPKL